MEDSRTGSRLVVPRMYWDVAMSLGGGLAKASWCLEVFTMMMWMLRAPFTSTTLVLTECLLTQVGSWRESK